MSDPRKFAETRNWQAAKSDTSRTGETAEGVPSPQDGAAAQECPESIGRYQVEGLLGRGAFGCVYLASDLQLQRRVAIKVPRTKAADAEAFLKEARNLAALDHPHIVPVFDVGTTEDGLCYLVSKLIEGRDLATAMCDSQFSGRQAAELSCKVADALHAAHKQQLVHRDIKPANILIDSSGECYVTDFGLALTEADYGKGPQRSGTPAYMSPEQAAGEAHLVDGRTDVFSLGVVFYELLTGVLPFAGDSEAELVQRITALDARPPRQLDDDIPRELERICLKALARRPVERYTTAKDMADDLRAFLAGPAEGSLAVVDEAIVTAESVPRGFECPYCHTAELPLTKRRISVAGWVVFVVFLVLCVLFSPIGLFIKEDYRVCSQCGAGL